MADLYDDPPPPMRYSTANAYEPPNRPTHVVTTPSGPMAVGALPDGWHYDLYQNPVYTDGNGTNWTYDDDGQAVKVTYGSIMTTAMTGASGGGPIFTPPTETEIKNDLVPQALKQPRIKATVDREVNAKSALWTGLGHGVATANRPANQGGPLNDPGWLGSDLIRQQALAQNPDWTPQQADNYAAAYTNQKAIRQASRQNYDPKTQTGTIYQRAAYDTAVQQGFGRPQYGEGAEYAVLNLNPTALIQLQQQLIKAQIPGSSTIAIGHVGDLTGDDATIAAYRNALAGANLAGIPIKEYLARQGNIAALAERAALVDGSPGDPKFDPTRVQKSVTLTGRGRARGQLRQMMANMLGRMPSEAEVNDYLDRLNGAERNNPAVTTTTYTRSGDSSTVREESDVDPTRIAEREVKGNNPKEYEAYQRLGFYNVMLSMMDGVG